VTVKTTYEIVHRTKSQLKNVKEFSALDDAHIPDEKRRKLDVKAFKCRFLGYEDDVKGYGVLNVVTGKVQIGRTVKLVEMTRAEHLMDHHDGEDATYWTFVYGLTAARFDHHRRW
jgi:hypothetical protein